jgi:hypothetical protein
MSKTLDVAMAGIIAGIVAYATSILGIGGTVIGAVLGAILYQIMSHLFKAPLEGIRTQNVEARIVYTIPLILIVAIEILFIFALLYIKPGNFFYILENATENNLFRSIGVGLIIMGLYPLIQSENIKKLYGYIIIIVGVIVLLGGFADFNTPITDLYSVIFSELGMIISLMVICALSYVIIAITKESVTIINDNKVIDFENYGKIEDTDVKYHKKLDHWFNDGKNGNDPKINNDDDTKRDHDMR